LQVNSVGHGVGA